MTCRTAKCKIKTLIPINYLSTYFGITLYFLTNYNLYETVWNRKELIDRMTKFSILLIFFLWNGSSHHNKWDVYLSNGWACLQKLHCCQKVLKKQSSYVANVWIIQATEHFPMFFPASFTHATHETLANLCKLFFREGVLLLRLKQFWVCPENSIKL